MSRSLQHEPLVRSSNDVAHFEHQRAQAIVALQLERTALDPVEAYALAYALRPDRAVVRAVHSLLHNTRLHGGRDGPGWIYAFVDTRDMGEDSRLLKIGTTFRDPYKRVAEWAAELTNESVSSSTSSSSSSSSAPLRTSRHAGVYLLFAYRTRRCRFAEALIHATLRREHVPNRVATRTQRSLTEYFLVGGELLWSTRFFIKSVTVFVDLHF